MLAIQKQEKPKPTIEKIHLNRLRRSSTEKLTSVSSTKDSDGDLSCRSPSMNSLTKEYLKSHGKVLKKMRTLYPTNLGQIAKI